MMLVPAVVPQVSLLGVPLPPMLIVSEPAPAANPPPLLPLHSNLFDPDVLKPRVNVPALLLLACNTPPLRIRKLAARQSHSAVGLQHAAVDVGRPHCRCCVPAKISVPWSVL